MRITMGGMAEWLKAAVLKTVERKLRGFESYSLRQEIHWEWISRVAILLLACSRFLRMGKNWNSDLKNSGFTGTVKSTVYSVGNLNAEIEEKAHNLVKQLASFRNKLRSQATG